MVIEKVTINCIPFEFQMNKSGELIQLKHPKSNFEIQLDKVIQPPYTTNRWMEWLVGNIEEILIEYDYYSLYTHITDEIDKDALDEYECMYAMEKGNAYLEEIDFEEDYYAQLIILDEILSWSPSYLEEYLNYEDSDVSVYNILESFYENWYNHLSEFECSERFKKILEESGCDLEDINTLSEQVNYYIEDLEELIDYYKRGLKNNC